MWAFVLFDLPNVTSIQKKAHVRFRNDLLQRGFIRLQWSVYARCYTSERSATAEKSQIERAVPTGGRVRMISVTDKQFERMVCVDSAKRGRVGPEKALGQILVV
jgi:CRISPR-associated protein Cas2